MNKYKENVSEDDIFILQYFYSLRSAPFGEPYTTQLAAYYTLDANNDVDASSNTFRARCKRAIKRDLLTRYEGTRYIRNSELGVDCLEKAGLLEDDPFLTTLPDSDPTLLPWMVPDDLHILRYLYSLSTERFGYPFVTRFGIHQNLTTHGLIEKGKTTTCRRCHLMKQVGLVEELPDTKHIRITDLGVQFVHDSHDPHDLIPPEDFDGAR